MVFICLIVGSVLDDRLGEVGPAAAAFLQGGVPGGEDLGVALAAEEQHPLVKDRQAADLCRAAAPHEGLSGDAVIIPDVHAVESPVVGGGLHVDVGVEQLGAAAPDAQGPVKEGLGS